MRKKETENIKRILRNQIKSIPGVVTEDHDCFRKGGRSVWLSVRRNRVMVDPVGYYYVSTEEARQFEFELKGL